MGFIMEGEKIPPQDRIARYCKFTSIDENGLITGEAFIFSERHSFLSVNWVEQLRLSNIDEEVMKLWDIYKTTLTVRPNAKIAILNVGNMIEYVLQRREDSRELSVLHMPRPPIDSSHSGIFGYSFMEKLIAELIAQTVRPENVFSQNQ